MNAADVIAVFETAGVSVTVDLAGANLQLQPASRVREMDPRWRRALRADKPAAIVEARRRAAIAATIRGAEGTADLLAACPFCGDVIAVRRTMTGTPLLVGVREETWASGGPEQVLLSGGIVWNTARPATGGGTVRGWRFHRCGEAAMQARAITEGVARRAG